MDSAEFNAAQWDHWLLVVSFVAIALSGLWLSYQWRQEQRKQRARTRLSQRLSLDSYHYGDSEHELMTTRNLSRHIVDRSRLARYAKDSADASPSGRYVRAKRRTYPTRIR